MLPLGHCAAEDILHSFPLMLLAAEELNFLIGTNKLTNSSDFFQLLEFLCAVVCCLFVFFSFWGFYVERKQSRLLRNAGQ